MNHKLLNISDASLWAPVTWCVAFAAVMIAAISGLDSVLQFDAAAITGGEYWRVLTGHITHWNGDHLFWDLSVFVVLGTMCERRNRAAFVACIVLAALAISAYVLWFLPEMPTYRGLSGIDTALFALLGVGFFRDAQRSGNRTATWLIALAAASLLVKTGFEFFTGATIFVDHTTAAFLPLPMAHVIGAVIGVGVGAIGSTKFRPKELLKNNFGYSTH